MRRLAGWLAVGALACGLWSCGCNRREIPSGPDVDVSVDPDVDRVDPPVDPGDPDIAPVDPPLDDDGDADADEDPEPLCPPDGPVGTACTIDDDCAAGETCLVERTQTWDDQEYVDWPGGYCVDASWVSGCAPGDPEACPEGARCVHLGSLACEDRWACMDACSPSDTGGVPFPFNACYRAGYRCDRALDMCLPKCSNDQECCEH